MPHKAKLLTSCIKYASGGYPVAACVFGYLGFSEETLFILTILIIIDFITGITKSYRLKDAITSARASSGVLAKMMLLIIPITIGLMFNGLHLNGEIILDGFLGMLIVAEAYSIIANIISIHLKEEFQEFDAVTLVLRTILKKMESLLQKIMKH